MYYSVSQSFTLYHRLSPDIWTASIWVQTWLKRLIPCTVANFYI